MIDATDLVFDETVPLRSLEVSDFAVKGGISLEMVADTAGEVANLAAAAAEAQAIVDDIGRGWLVPWFEDDLDDARQVLTDGAEDAARASRLLDGVWRQAGGDRPQRWFVLLCSPVESRARVGSPATMSRCSSTTAASRSSSRDGISDLEKIAGAQDLQLTIGGDYQARYESFGVSQTCATSRSRPTGPTSPTLCASCTAT